MVNHVVPDIRPPLALLLPNTAFPSPGRPTGFSSPPVSNATLSAMNGGWALSHARRFPSSQSATLKSPQDDRIGDSQTWKLIAGDLAFWPLSRQKLRMGRLLELGVGFPKLG